MEKIHLWRSFIYINTSNSIKNISGGLCSHIRLVSARQKIFLENVFKIMCSKWWVFWKITIFERNLKQMYPSFLDFHRFPFCSMGYKTIIKKGLHRQVNFKISDTIKWQILSCSCCFEILWFEYWVPVNLWWDNIFASTCTHEMFIQLSVLYRSLFFLQELFSKYLKKYFLRMITLQ